MITEDYCSYEIAKLLKEKGFDVPIWTRYEGSNKVIFGDKYNWNDSLNGQISAPTHQMVLKWLRGKGIYITIVYGDYPSLKKVFWTPQIDSLEGFDLPDNFYAEYNTYEEAVEAAIKYYLEKMI